MFLTLSIVISVNSLFVCDYQPLVKIVVVFQADVIVNVIATEKPDLKRASRVSAAIRDAAGPQLEKVTIPVCFHLRVMRAHLSHHCGCSQFYLPPDTGDASAT